MARPLRVLACAVVAAALAVPVGSGASAAAHSRKPDLSVTSVKPLASPATVAPGEKTSVRVTVRNAGKAKAPSSTATIALSTDTHAGDDTALQPAVAVPGLAPGKAWTGRVAVTVPAGTAGGSYFLLACADPKQRIRESSERNNCKASTALLVSAAPTSHDLIDADVAAHVLTPEKGLTYKVFSDFDDPRLPTKYAAPADGLQEGALEEAAERWTTLSPATQETLRPFLIPPFYPGSHWTPAAAGRVSSANRGISLDSPWCSGSSETQPAYQSWEYEDTPGGDFRIWWLKSNPGDKTLADHLVTALERILPALSTYMGHSIKPDSGGFCGGDSAAVDIALVDAQTAMTYPNGACDADGTAVHMTWPRTKPAPWADIDPYLAHEVLHMIQFAMPSASSCLASSWMREMTAEWIQDYVTDPIYPVGLAPDDTEHLSSTLYFQRPDVSLDSTLPSGHDYGSYLFPLFEARHGDRDFVKNVWANAGSMKPTEAVNAALPSDGFNSVWPEFALALWNQDPVHDFKDWDQLAEGASIVGTQGIKVGTHHLKVHVEHLATKYLALDFDKGVTELEVTNDQAGEKDASLQAVIEYNDGSTKVMDLSDEPTAEICIDDGTKRVRSVVLIFGNANQSAPIDFAPTIEGKASCGCPDVAPRSAARAGATCTGNLTFSWTHEIVKLNDDGSEESHTTETGHGTLGIGFLPPQKGESGIWHMDPASTYQVESSRHYEYYGSCAETSDTSDVGSGTLGDLASFATDDPDSDQVWIDALIGMGVTETWHSVDCFGSHDGTTTDPPPYVVAPPCPEAFLGGAWWKFDPVSPGSHTYRIDCTDTDEWEDGLGQHTQTATVTGTITLP